MIFDILDDSINKMKELRHLEARKANQAQQFAIDAKYTEIVGQVKDFVEAIDYVQKNLSFSMSESLQSDLTDLLKNIQSIILTGFADKGALSKSVSDFKSIQNTMKKDWSMHFPDFTRTTISTLKVIIGIDSEKSSGCLNNIKAAENWTVNKDIFIRLKDALGNAEALIQSLNMDQEINEFLTKMTSGKATIADLNEYVLSWIRKEALEGKIKLSFHSK